MDLSRRLRTCSHIVFLACVSTALVHQPARAEETTATTGLKFVPQQSFYVELLGSAVAASLNYDFRPTRNLAVRGGFMGWGGSDDYILIFPVTVSALVGKNQHNFEFGGGPVFLAGEEIADFNTDVIASFFMGYRLQPPAGGFLFRAGIGPLFGDGEWLIWPQFSFGVAF